MRSRYTGSGMRKWKPSGIALCTSLFLVLFIFWGCADNLPSSSRLEGLRVLALVADPLEAGPSDRVTVSPVTYATLSDAVVSEEWSYCPITEGPSSGFKCISSACEIRLTDGNVGAGVSFEPRSLLSVCASSIAMDAPLAENPVSPSATVLPGIIRYRVRSASGDERTAVLQFPLWIAQAPPSRNRAPHIANVSLWVGDEQVGPMRPVVKGETVDVRVELDPSYVDIFKDEAGREREESMVVSFYATSGKFEDNRSEGLMSHASWKGDTDATAAEPIKMFVAVRDLRGGQSVAGPLPIPMAP